MPETPIDRTPAGARGGDLLEHARHRQDRPDRRRSGWRARRRSPRLSAARRAPRASSLAVRSPSNSTALELPGPDGAGRSSPGSRASRRRFGLAFEPARRSSAGCATGRPELDRAAAATSVRRSPRRSRSVRKRCVAMSLSPRRNQVPSPSRAKPSITCHVSPATSPTLRPGDAGQRVHDRVLVRADRERVALQVVAGVDDDGQVAGREDSLQPIGELRSSDASGQAYDTHRFPEITRYGYPSKG